MNTRIHEGPLTESHAHIAEAAARYALESRANPTGHRVRLTERFERHPLIGGLVAFGFGFGLASLLCKTSKREG